MHRNLTQTLETVGEHIDLKAYEADMRYLIDTYIRAEESEKISAFDDLNLVQLIVERGPDAVQAAHALVLGGQGDPRVGHMLSLS